MECPNCGSHAAGLEYGGERGDAGPFVYCDQCGYSEEDAIRQGAGPRDKRSEQYRDGQRNAFKACVEWLHTRAQSMNDRKAADILNHAAHDLGEMKVTICGGGPK